MVAHHVHSLTDMWQVKTMTKRRRGNKESKKAKKAIVAVVPPAAPVATPPAHELPRQRGK